MAKVLVSETNLQAIANAIRQKNGTDETYTPSEMSAAISGLPSGNSGFEYLIFGTDTTYLFSEHQTGNPNFLVAFTEGKGILYIKASDGWLYYKQTVAPGDEVMLVQIASMTIGGQQYVIRLNIGNGLLEIQVSGGNQASFSKTSLNNTLSRRGVNDTVKMFILGIGNVQNLPKIPRDLIEEI